MADSNQTVHPKGQTVLPDESFMTRWNAARDPQELLAAFKDACALCANVEPLLQMALRANGVVIRQIASRNASNPDDITDLAEIGFDLARMITYATTK